MIRKGGSVGRRDQGEGSLKSIWGRGRSQLMKWATIAGGGWSLGRGTLEGRGTPRGGWYQESGSVVKRAWRKEGAQGRADAAKRKNQVSLPLSLPSIPATFPLSKRPRVIVAFTSIVITSPPDTFPRPRWGIGVTRVEAPPLSASSWSHARTRLFITRRRRGRGRRDSWEWRVGGGTHCRHL